MHILAKISIMAALINMAMLQCFLGFVESKNRTQIC